MFSLIFHFWVSSLLWTANYSKIYSLIKLQMSIQILQLSSCLCPMISIRIAVINLLFSYQFCIYILIALSILQLQLLFGGAFCSQMLVSSLRYNPCIHLTKSDSLFFKIYRSSCPTDVTFHDLLALIFNPHCIFG